MSILLNPTFHPQGWLEALSELLPDIPIRMWPEVGDPQAVEYAVVWKHDPADLRRYPNLRAILSVTVGMEQFLKDGYPAVPIVRLVDEAMTEEMALFALHWVIHFQRRIDRHLAGQRHRAWEAPITPLPAEYPVGVLGYGTIGRRIGEKLAGLGFPVHAWRRAARDGGEAGTMFHYGPDGLDEMLGVCAAVINILPRTPATEGLMNRRRFAACRPGSVYISIGRGATTVEADLVRALDEGPLRAAALDVTAREPLPEDSPLWDHPHVHITPHVSGQLRPATSAPHVAANIRRLQNGQDPFPLFDPALGY